MMYGSSMDYSQEWGVREEELAGRLLFDNQEGRGSFCELGK